jgi:hypothetical protein
VIGEESTADRRLVGLAEEFAFILPLAESRELAVTIVLDILGRGATADDDGPPRFTIAAVNNMPMFQVPSPFEGRFWYPDARAGERLELVPEKGMAHWHGPRAFQADTPRDFMLWEAKNRSRDGKLPPVDIDLLGIRLRHDVVLANLRFRGLWPPTKLQADPAAPSLATTLPLKLQVDVDPPAPVKLPLTLQVEAPSTSRPVSTDTAVPPTSASTPERQTPISTATKRKRLGAQEELILAAGRVIYGDDWPMLRPAELQRAIDTALKAGALKTVSPPKHWVAPLGSCTSVLEKLGKLQSN